MGVVVGLKFKENDKVSVLDLLVNDEKSYVLEPLTLFDMGFFETSVMGGGGGMRAPHHDFVVIAPIIMKFGTGIELDVFYTMATKTCDVTTITSLRRHNLYFSRHIGLIFRCLQLPNPLTEFAEI